ncbi:MAG: [LysW]-aminoadipate/[LysW]-glutamate kinase [Thermocladium sp.]
MFIVVKIGGSVIRRDMDPVVKELPELIRAGHSLILIHGGGFLVNELMNRMGLTPRFITSPSGVVSRYTDLETLGVYVMAMMRINKELASKLQRVGVNAMGLSGIDGALLLARRKDKLIMVDERGRQRVIDGGYTGKISSINADLLKSLMGGGIVPLIAPIAMDGDTGDPLNVDSDQVLEAISSRMRPDYSIILTDVDGVLINGSPLPRVDPGNDSLLSIGEVSGGMRRKLRMAMQLGSGGVRVIISSGLRESPISSAISGAGTHIY